MTDFNKGDFTQQGVDGHVNAKLRLNAKRYLDIDLTSNEQASGCTISGHVYDSLNDITYPIGSAPSGNIEITENTAEGSPLNIAQYATATVNVSGGGEHDLLKLTVTIENSAESAGRVTQDDTNISFNGLYFLDNTVADAGDTPIEYTLAKGESITFDLYYSYNDPAVGVFFPANDTTIASNVVNLTVDDSSPDYRGYNVTDSTVNSSIKLTHEILV